MISIQVLKDRHITELWEIIQGYPEYFNDSVKMQSIEDFKSWINKDVIDCIIGVKNNEVIGCGYINSLHDGLAEINIFVKRKSVVLEDIKTVLKICLISLFKKHTLKMIYATVRVDNKASIRLLHKMGFKIADVLIGYEQINGKPVDCYLATIMAEEVGI